MQILHVIFYGNSNLHNLHNTTTCAFFAHMPHLNCNLHFLHIAFLTSPESGMCRFCTCHFQHSKNANYCLIINAIIIQQPLEIILRRKASVAQIPVGFAPVLDASVIEQPQILRDDEWHHARLHLHLPRELRFHPPLEVRGRAGPPLR